MLPYKSPICSFILLAENGPPVGLSDTTAESISSIENRNSTGQSVPEMVNFPHFRNKPSEGPKRWMFSLGIFAESDSSPPMLVGGSSSESPLSGTSATSSETQMVINRATALIDLPI
jgi:hypothetical protein